MPPRLSSRPFLSLFLLLIGMLLVLMLIGAYGFYAIQKDLLENSGKSLALSATDIADKIDRLVHERVQDLDLLSQSLDLQAQGADHIASQLHQVKNSHPSFHSISFVDPRGSVVASIRKPYYGRDLSDLPGLQAIGSGETRHLDVSYTLENRQKTLSLIFTQGLPRSGSQDTKGAIVAEVPISYLEQIFFQTQQAIQQARNTKFPIEWQLLTHAGEVIVDSILHEEGRVSLTTLDLPSALLVTSGKSGFIQETHKRRHVPVITGFAQTKGQGEAPSPNWGVLIRIDESDVLPTIHAKIMKLGIGMGLVLIPLVSIIFWTVRKVVMEHHRVVDAETKYRDIFEHAHEGIFQSTPSGLFLSANPAMAKILGYDSPEDLIHSVNDLTQQLYVDNHQRSELLRQLETHGFIQNFEFQFYRRDGMIRWGSGNIRAVQNADGTVKYLEGTLEDITERKQAVTRLLQLQEQLLIEQGERTQQVEVELDKARATLVTQAKLATLGQLSGSIAHELRNPLGAMRNAIFLLKRRSSNYDDQAKRYLEMIEEEVQNSDLIIQALLEVARGKEPVKQNVVFQELLDKIMKEKPIPEGVSYHSHFDPELFTIWVDPSQFVQVIHNLLHNASQAMEGKGQIWVQGTYSSDIAEIIISDTGPGISEEHRDHVFEPLYTTKPKGTGLGLTLCREIIERHGGTIISLDNPTGGAAFHIRLPLYQKDSVGDNDKQHHTV